MSTRLFGVLVDGLNKPIINATVTLLARQNTLTILNGSEAIFRTDAAGFYNITVQSGHYNVIIGPQGIEPYKAGEIALYADSEEGSLNGYLVNWVPEELTPEVIKEVQDLVARSEAFALDAGRSASAANLDATDARGSKSAAQSAANDALVYKNDSKDNADAAKLAQQGASGSANTATQAVTTVQNLKSDVEQLKNDTQTIKDDAVRDVTALKDTAEGAATTATEKALAAAGSATTAGESAVAADSAADRAETAAASAEQVTQASLKKDQNLKDLTDKVAARKELQVQAVVSKNSSVVGDYNSFTSPNIAYELRLANDGGWRVVNNSDNSSSPLSMEGGGTGAKNDTDARINLKLDRYTQHPNETVIYSPDGIKYIGISNSTIGSWGAFDSTGNGRWIPLGVGQGGTGAITDEGARNNLHLGAMDTVTFAGLNTSLYNGSNSGLVYMRNYNADRTLISYSAIYNEVQSGISKTTIRTTKEGAGTAFYQFDENGQFSTQKIKIGAGYAFTAEGGENNNLQLLAQANVPLDDWANFVRYNWYNDMSLSGAVRSGSDKIKCHRLRVYSPGVDSWDYDFYPQGYIKSRSYNGLGVNGYWGVEDVSGQHTTFWAQTTHMDGGWNPVVSGAVIASGGYSTRSSFGTISNGASGWGRSVIKLLGDTQFHRAFEFTANGDLNSWAQSPSDSWGGSFSYSKNPTSDRDAKKEITYTDGKESYDRVMQWLPTMFKYKWNDIQRYGLIAQDLLKVDPQYVKLVPGAPIFEDVIGVDEEGKEYVDRQIETGVADDTLSLDSNVILTDMACAVVYMGGQLEQQRKELDELKAIIKTLTQAPNQDLP